MRIRFRIQLIHFVADTDFYLMWIQVTKMTRIRIHYTGLYCLLCLCTGRTVPTILCTLYRAYSAERVKLGRFLLNREGGKAPFLAHLKAALLDPSVPLEQFRNERVSLSGSSGAAT